MIQRGKWLWDCEDVQEDLKTLKQEYKKQLGYDLTEEQCFDAWYLHSEYCCANWIYVDGDLTNSEWAVKKVLSEQLPTQQE